MNPIALWWQQCLQDKTWWPKKRNNMVHKDTFTNHFVSFLDTNGHCSNDRCATSKQVFWENFYKIQPIPQRDRRWRRVVQQPDGTTKREMFIRLPKHYECLDRMAELSLGRMAELSLG